MKIYHNMNENIEENDAMISLTTKAFYKTIFEAEQNISQEKESTTAHSAIGIVENVGKNVCYLNIGDRVLIPSIVEYIFCHNCQKSHNSQFVRVPFANMNLIKLSSDVPDHRNTLVSEHISNSLFKCQYGQPSYRRCHCGPCQRASRAICYCTLRVKGLITH